MCIRDSITSAHDAYDFVLKNAGANIPCRDIVDERIIEEVRTGIPVSYTHLDVYKRQIFDSYTAKNKFVPFAASTNLEDLLPV